MDDMWCGVESLDRLRSGAAAESSGVICVSIEQLNVVGKDVSALKRELRVYERALLMMAEDLRKRKYAQLLAPLEPIAATFLDRARAEIEKEEGSKSP